MATLMGIDLVASELAVTVTVRHVVTRHSTRQKKRKNWRVERVEKTHPAVLIMGRTYFVHPSLMDGLKAAMS